MTGTPAGGPRIAGAVLDHVAHAVQRWQDVWERYASDLGAVWASGGPGPGFAPGQVRFANGARIEMLMPWDVGVNDFLARFLGSHGPAPHHLTFKVTRLDDAIEEVRRAGFEPVGIDTSDPEWKEAFLLPKQATGTVVQLAEAAHAWSSPPPDGYPRDTRLRRDGSGPTAPATLEWVSHVVGDLDHATVLFCGLLDGDVVGSGTEGGLRWLDVRWTGPLGVRLIAAVDPEAPGLVSDWLSGRPGRIRHVAVETEEPDAVPGAIPAESPLACLGAGPGDLWEIPPRDNYGLGVVLSGFGGATGGGPASR